MGRIAGMDEQPLKPPRQLKALADGTISRWWAVLIVPAWLACFIIASPFILAVLLWQFASRPFLRERP